MRASARWPVESRLAAMAASSAALASALVLALVMAACGGELADAATDGADSDVADLTQGFGPGFHPKSAPHGGFGGGSCKAVRTPVVFLHGNGDRAASWGNRASDGGPSVLAVLRAQGYRNCELYGVDWLSAAERKTPELVYHSLARAKLVRGFLDDVRGATGMSQVDLVGHSMGGTLGLHALEDPAQLAGVRRFVAISAALRGLVSCTLTGPANPFAPTCGSQNPFDADTFGFFPYENPRMEAGGFRARPSAGGPRYYTIGAGSSDEVLCPGCDSALFDQGPGVWAQLDIGKGHPTLTVPLDDSSGIGHVRARSDSGQLLARLLSTDCRGKACCKGPGPACR
jgi:pimeloyl-ACP methyl ester carboxylesterase